VRVATLLLAAAAATAAAPIAARAAPAADVVLVWAPGAKTDGLAAVARKAGAAVVDRSPAAQAPPDTAAVVARAIAAYDALRLDDAWAALDEAVTQIDRTGAAGLTRARLGDLFLYRALVRAQQGNADGAWDDLVRAATVDPTRVLDPARFPPRVTADLQRARDSLAGHAPVGLAVAAPPDCTVFVDGDAAPAELRVVAGTHWIRAACSAHAPWGTRIDVAVDTKITAAGAALAPPSDDDALIQARTIGARAFVRVDVRGDVALVRLVGADGRERDRRTVSLAHGADALAPVAAVVGDLLVPGLAVAHRSHWYQSKWLWAAGAAVIVAAVAIPVTAALAADHDATTFTVRPTGITW
jgi:hypothetical protein